MSSAYEGKWDHFICFLSCDVMDTHILANLGKSVPLTEKMGKKYDYY